MEWAWLCYSSSLYHWQSPSQLLSAEWSWWSAGNAFGDPDFSWFTDGSYLKGNSNIYGARYAITTPFDIVEASPLLMATSAHQAELYILFFLIVPLYITIIF